MPTIDVVTQPFQVLKMNLSDWFLQMLALGDYQDINAVGSFKDPNDQSARTAHRDIDLPWHRDGIESQAIKDLQGGMYITSKEPIDVVGMYCLQDNWSNEEGRTPCTTILAEAAPDADPYDNSQFRVVAEVDLAPGYALIWDNRLWHGREGPVGSRVLMRFWTTLPERLTHPMVF
jgi:hypothetical protein